MPTEQPQPGPDLTGLGSAGLLADLQQLREVLARTSLGLLTPSARDSREEARSVLRQLDDYLLPRLTRADTPLLVVVGGSTGAGKSTLVNTLVGRAASPAGVLRPTTRAPVLVHHPDDRERLRSGDLLLPHLPRADVSGGVAGALRLVEDEHVPAGLVLLDAPDLDSVVAMNRDLAAQLLAAADLWLFVTSAARYADAVPWAALRKAAQRRTTVVIVLDRVPPGDVEELAADLGRMLSDNGLADAPVLTVPETVPDAEGLLPVEAVVAVRDWLRGLGADRQARQAAGQRTLTGALAALRPRLERVADGLDEQADAAAARRREADEAYQVALARVTEALSDGSVLRGEVLARWQELAGTGDLLRGLEARVGRARDRTAAWLRGRSVPAAQLEAAIETTIEALLRTEADNAAERASGAWRASPSGRALLDSRASDVLPLARDLTRSSADLPERTRHVVRVWQAAVLDLVRSQAGGRRRSARLMSYGVNGLGLLVMITVFAHTGGLTGAEGGIAAGTSLIGQRLLEALLGDQAMRRLAEQAREDLLDRVSRLLGEEAARYHSLLPEPAGSGAELRSLAARIEAEQATGVRQ